MNHLKPPFLLQTVLIIAINTAQSFAADSKETPADGFVELVNGKDLDGWVVEGTKTFMEGDDEKPVWTVKDGQIHCAGKGFGFLRYDEKVSDFELRVEYRQKAKSNSGIGIRYDKFDPSPGKKSTRPSFAGYEIQLLDDGNKPPDNHSTGSLYRYVAPKASAAKPAGEWNEISIECRGPKIKITLNGKVVQDVDQSKIKAIAKKPLEGHVAVQNHGGEVDFRSIKLKKL